MLTAEILHDVRQSLSSIEAIAYYLEMTVHSNAVTEIPPPSPATRSHYLQEIQRLTIKVSDELTSIMPSPSLDAASPNTPSS